MMVLRKHGFAIATGVAILLGFVLRLKGIHDPIFDHPNWRQGDEAAIARNFALLNFNPLYPQTNYDGAPPNYVELELQIVPFLAATLYKIVGIHEIFGRLLTIGFSLATVGVLASFGRWLFSSPVAGLTAAFAYAVMPGAVYYGRTFTPDATMVFFLTIALYLGARMLVEDEAPGWRRVAGTTALLTLAYLAKPVSLVALLPLLAIAIARWRNGRTMPVARLAVFFVVPLAILAWYQHDVSSHAEWHWSSGIMSIHVMPLLGAALTNGGAFLAKLGIFWQMLGLLERTMLGAIVAPVALVGLGLLIPFAQARSRSLLWTWLAGGLAYVFVVVTYETVDYYMLLLLPLAALLCGAAVDAARVALARFVPRYANLAFGALALALVAGTAAQGVAAVAPYYAYNKQAYRDAIALAKTLDADALVVTAHYGPDVLYYLDRFGWEEDPALWRPFDQKSAMRKGARYFISIEDLRMRRNTTLCDWLQQFPLLQKSGASWPVYVTDLSRRNPHPKPCPRVGIEKRAD
jgi:hypothetical protein